MAEINILVEPKRGGVPPKSWFKQQVREIADWLDLHADFEISLMITDDIVMQQLNRDYRSLDKTTDVLSFGMKPIKPEDKGNPLFVNPPDHINHLGEVVISYPRAIAQAIEYKHPVKCELKALITHGILHLCGYDHEKEADEQIMFKKQLEILQKLEKK